MVTREALERREEAILAGYAMRSGDSRGRHFEEREHPYRTAYQRDRDRVIHTTAFRRLEYKTQVFVYSVGDHYRNRLTHTIEVAQIGRTLARSLACNEDLTEAICLAHDLGHPPFGHVGEAKLNQLMVDHGGYDHQRQTYRILTALERRYPEHPGLNLTYEVLEGVVKHDTSYDEVDAREYSPHELGTVECQLSNLADEIAYDTSDLDDGLRSQILDPREVAELAITQYVLASLGESPDADLGDTMLRRRFIRRLVGIVVLDTIQATEQEIRASGAQTLADIRQLPNNLATYSSEMKEKNAELKKYLFENFYRHHHVVRMATKAERTLERLFSAYAEQPLQLPPDTLRLQDEEPEGLYRVICDYIAGMTDRFAVQEYKRLYDPDERV